MSPTLIVALAAVFVSVALLVALVASRFLSEQSPERRRLREVMQAPVAVGAGGAVATASARFGQWVPKSVRNMSTLERRLANAGYRSETAAKAFSVAQFGVPAVLVLAVVGLYGWQDRSNWVAAGIAAVLGYLAPGFLLDYQVSQRRKQIRNGLPDVLDLLIVCLEAGSSLDQSVVKASDELSIAYPALAEELRVLTTETRAGKPRIEAFKNLAQRTKVDDVRALVAMLVQTDRFGTSVAQALRTLADTMRTKRRQMAEEKANKVGVKLVFPLVLCLFPAFFVVVLGPAVIKIMRAFSEMGR
jgi:tight adherence protein C